MRRGENYTLTVLPTITKENSTFKGWYHNGTKLSDGNVVNLTSDSVIEARWDDKNIYKVSLNPQSGTFKDGTIGADEPIKVYAGNSIGEIPAPSREGWDFLGWYTAAEDGEKVDYTFIPENDCTLYAH